MTEPVIAITSFRPLPGRSTDVVDLLRPILALVHAEPGCLLYALHASEDSTMWLIEKWATEADADRHGASSPALASLADKVSPLLEPDSLSLVEMRALPAGDPSKGSL